MIVGITVLLAIIFCCLVLLIYCKVMSFQMRDHTSAVHFIPFDETGSLVGQDVRRSIVNKPEHSSQISAIEVRSQTSLIESKIRQNSTTETKSSFDTKSIYKRNTSEQETQSQSNGCNGLENSSLKCDSTWKKTKKHVSKKENSGYQVKDAISSETKSTQLGVWV